MLFTSKVSAAYGKLTHSQKVVANYVDENYEDIAFSTLEELIDAGRQLAKKRGDYLFRFDPRIEEQNTAFSDEVRRLGFTQDMASDYSLFQPRMCYVTDLQGLTKDALLAKYRRSTRYNVRLAERRGVTVRVGTLDDLPEFHRMMKITAAKAYDLMGERV